MKDSMVKLIALFAIFACLFSFSSCKDEPAPPIYIPDYSYSSDENESKNGEETTAAQDASFTVDTSWQNNYKVNYTYFDGSASSGSVTINEIKSASRFEASYPGSGNLIYYVAEGANIKVYTVIPEEKEYNSTEIKNQTISSLSSTFMKLTSVSETLPSLSNVIYMYDETVAGRNCKKYMQRAYTDGLVTETVLVWVDAEFGFAAKCEAYDAEENLTSAWETLTFRTGDITDGDFDVDLEDYAFTEE